MTEKINNVLNVLKSTLVAMCPYDTGNLSASIDIYDRDTAPKIIIGNDTVDYAIYTNEKWSKGRNPNEGWVQRAIEACRPLIQAIFGGTISQAEIDEYIKKQGNIYHTTQQRRVAEIQQELERIQ